MVVAIMIPVAIFVPSVIRPTPPPVIGGVAALSFFVQFMPAVLSLGAMLAVLADRLFQVGFGLFDMVLAFCPIVLGMCARHNYHHGSNTPAASTAATDRLIPSRAAATHNERTQHLFPERTQHLFPVI